MKKIFSFNAVWAIAFALFLLNSESQAQIKMPAASPAATVKQTIGLSDITVEYSRPSMRGRKIFGELEAYGELWRTGANKSTQLSISEEVMMEGNKVPAGKYALYTIPGEQEWTIIIHKNTEHWGDGGQDYKQEQDLVRFKVKAEKSAKPVETFTIGFSDLTMSGGTMFIAWENAYVPVKITTDVDAKVMAQIQEKVVNNAEATPALYASAASYYMNNNKDLNQALTWMKKANEKDPKFYNLHYQAQLQAKMKDYKGARKTAQQSIELAKKENNADYVALNEKLLADIKNMK